MVVWVCLGCMSCWVRTQVSVAAYNPLALASWYTLVASKGMTFPLASVMAGTWTSMLATTFWRLTGAGVC